MAMSAVIRRGSWLAMLAGVTLLALAAWVATAGLAHADPATVSIASANVASDGSTTVGITVNPGTGETVGTATIDVSYDATNVSATACTPVATCNTAYGADTVNTTCKVPPQGCITAQILYT